MTVVAFAKVVLEGDTVKLTKALRGAQAAMKQAGQKMQAIGKGMTTKLTLPIIAVGGVSVKMAATFEESLEKMEGLVGVQREQLDAWRGDIRRMAVEFGSSASKAADALFFITSAGLRGSKAMNTLEVSLKASAFGMGEVKVVADAATSAMNAYAKQGLSAERATEILTAGVRKGKLEAEALAPVMGVVTGTAAALDISFEDVVGTLAVFSRTGTQATVAATQLNSIMASLLGTSEEGEAALRAQGLSLGQLREVVAKPGGLLEVLRLLDEAFPKKDDLKAVIPNLRAFRGVMNALAQDVEAVDDVMLGVRESFGIVEEALEAAQGPALQMRKVWAQVKDAMIEIGDAAIPVVIPALQRVAVIVKDFTEKLHNLNPEIKETIVVILGITAAIGPLLAIFGTLVAAISAIKFAALLGAFTALGPFLAPGAVLLVGLGVLAGLLLKIKIQALAAETALREMEKTLKTTFEGFSPEAAIKRLEQMEGTLAQLDEGIDETKRKIFALRTERFVSLGRTREIVGLIQGLEAEQATLEESKARWEGFAAVLDEVVATALLLAEANKKGGGGPSINTPPPWLAAAEDAAKELLDTLAAIDDLQKLLGADFDATTARADAFSTAIDAMVLAGVDLKTIIEPLGVTLEVLAIKYRILTDAADVTAKELEAFEDALEDAKAITEAMLTPQEAYNQAVGDLQAKLFFGFITQEAFNRTLEEYQEILNDATSATVDWGDRIEQTASRALSSFINFTTGARGSFREFVDQVIADLLRLSAQFLASSFLRSVGVKLPGFQEGGFLESGRFGVVGETGPEIIKAGRAGITITPLPGFQRGGFLAPGRLGVVGEAGMELLGTGRGGATPLFRDKQLFAGPGAPAAQRAMDIRFSITGAADETKPGNIQFSISGGAGEPSPKQNIQFSISGAAGEAGIESLQFSVASSVGEVVQGALSGVAARNRATGLEDIRFSVASAAQQMGQEIIAVGDRLAIQPQPIQQFSIAAAAARETGISIPPNRGALVQPRPFQGQQFSAAGVIGKTQTRIALTALPVGDVLGNKRSGFRSDAGGVFGDYLAGLLQDFQSLRTKSLVEGLFGALEVSLPGFARGGTLKGGELGIVGEEGAEIVQAGRGGLTVQPLRGQQFGTSGGEGAEVTVALTIQAVDARSFAELLDANPGALVAPLVKAFGRSRVLRGLV